MRNTTYKLSSKRSTSMSRRENLIEKVVQKRSLEGPIDMDVKRISALGVITGGF